MTCRSAYISPDPFSRFPIVQAPKDIEDGISKYCLPTHRDEINRVSENVEQFLNEKCHTSDDGGENDDPDTILRNIK